MLFFSDWKKKKIMVSTYIYPLALLSRNSTLRWRPIPEHWLLSTWKWITINLRTDGFHGEAAVTWFQPVLTRLSYDSSLLHPSNFSHQSIRAHHCLSCLTVCNWYTRLTQLLIKVAGKAGTTSDILGMLCLLSSVFHNIPLQTFS